MSGGLTPLAGGGRNDPNILINPYNSFNNPDAKPAFNLHPTKQPSEIVVDDY